MKSLLVVLGVAATFAAAYFFGRACFDETPTTGLVRPDSSTGAGSKRDNEALPLRAATSAAPSPELPADDQILETTMTQHPQAMLMLRGAISHEFFYRGGPFAACRALAADSLRCWVRFLSTIRGQFADIQIDRVDCEPPGQRKSSAVEICLRERFTSRDPLGIPADSAAALADYTGPVEVAWYRE